MKNKNILRLGGALLAAVIGSAQAAQDLATTLDQAVDDDPQLAAARAQLRADEERLAQARSLFLPQVALEGDAARVKQDTDYGAGGSPFAQDWDGEYNSYSYGVALTQPLFRLESFTLYKQAETLIDQAQLNYAVARQDLTLRVAEAYFGVLRAQTVLASFESELTAIEQQLKRAQRTFELGTGTITDINDAQARLDLIHARRLEAMNVLQIARERLRRLTGEPVQELAPMKADFSPQAPEPADPSAWAALAEARNLQVQLAQAGLEFAQDEVSRQRAQRFPKVDLYARYGGNRQSETNFGADLDANQSSVGVNLTVPLFTGGAISSQVREAQAGKDRAFEQLRAARRAASLEAESAFLNLQANRQQIGALEQAAKSIRLNEESTQKGLELGLRTTLDLFNIQRERFAAERDVAAERYNYLLNYLRLQAAVGRAVEPEAVRAVNQFLVQP